MSQPDNTKPQPGRNEPIQEQVFFDGTPSWIGRLGSFLLTYLIAAILVVVPIILQITGHGPLWLIAVGIVLAIIIIFAQVGLQKTIRYRITNYRIDYQSGLLTRHIDSLELWYVDHIRFSQGILERLTGTGTIEVVTDDPRVPRLVLRSIPGGREILDQLKMSTLAAKRQRGLIELDQNSQ